VASLDPDVLVDLAGPRAPSSSFLACRPARSIVTIAGVARPHDAPRADEVVGTVSELRAAMERARQSLAVESGAPDARNMAERWESAVRAHQRGLHADARRGYEEVLALQPGFAPAHYLLGMLLREGGDLVAARAHFDAALAAAPRFLDARIAAAKEAHSAGDAAAAIALCTAGMEHAPESAALWRTLALAQLALGNEAGATASLERVVTLAPMDVDARFNLGAVRQRSGAHGAAVTAYTAVLAADRTHVAAYKNLGETLFAAGRYEEWFANFGRFEANCPDALPMLVQGLEACHYQADFRRFGAFLDRIIAGRFVVQDDMELVDCLEQLLYLLLFFDVAPDAMLRLARTYDAAARRVYGEPLPPRRERRAGRVRVGYLSADLRNHVMGKMMWEVLQHHDRQRFELFFYSLSAVEDEWTRGFRALADRYEVVAALHERAAAERIAADDLDLLVDLSTHTRGARPGILALKPARVQLTHVASAGTVGLSAIDFKLTDRYADVPASERWQIEPLLPMDGCVYPFRRAGASSARLLRRSDLGVGDDTIVIGAFVTGLKLSPRCLGLWREVLARVPRAVLAFSPIRMEQRPLYLRLTEAAGIPADRIVFVPQGRDDAENEARYALVDFVLDPMPYGGTNGTLEALDMGVPVVTLAGTRHGERTSYSILSNLGVTATIAQTPDEYIAIACRLARDSTFMAAVRAAIAAGLAVSPLGDAVGHMRALERAYLAALAAKAPEVLADDAGG
jgi:predicted O-linked N-acetylglucosamine transferase (SPINDLY family)